MQRSRRHRRRWLQIVGLGGCQSPVSMDGGLKQCRKHIGNSVVYNSHERIGREYSNCVICVEDFEDGDMCGVLNKCEHVYHTYCINKWLTNSKHCPLCRSNVIGNITPSKKEN
ncbi:hypothetical protein Ddye_017825 [Dipteronia dyeriana]|uniref:RING-type domain-containing protein n=1 Tax=Dipteronia dyeriana TaxID=168575 RepID=A0AAD9U9F9_9ROSI|nr:hypothetical protein Ddye_017825 [Dipteronia dyeriana]